MPSIKGWFQPIGMKLHIVKTEILYSLCWKFGTYTVIWSHATMYQSWASVIWKIQKFLILNRFKNRYNIYITGDTKNIIKLKALWSQI